jgi:hypothetical protein
LPFEAEFTLRAFDPLRISERALELREMAIRVWAALQFPDERGADTSEACQAQGYKPTF